MADDADLAQARNEYELAYLLARRLPAGPPPTGVCHHCGAPVPELLRFCDADCRDDWQRRSAHGGLIRRRRQE